MRRLLPAIATAWLALVLAPAVLADDPRCADWEQHGAPPGIDMQVVCAANQIIGTYTGGNDVGTADAPLGQYAAAALLAGVGLAIAGVLAARFVGRRTARRMAPEAPDDWWVCPACQSINAVGRETCYACHASPAATRDSPPPVMHRVD